MTFDGVEFFDPMPILVYSHGHIFAGRIGSA